jgi:DNA polymerase III subunit delta
MDDVVKIISEIKSGKLAPIYFLMGEESYFIDKVADFIEDTLLQEHERDFNQTVVYGRDTTIEEVVSAAKRYPMMADRQVVIVKEAQELSRSIDKLESYAENPMNTTVLVFCYKYKTLDKRKKITKILAKNGLVFESKKLYENQVGGWIANFLKEKGYSIEPKANAMLVEFIGNDLNRIANELNKLQLLIPKGSTITAQNVEDNIGFSKDYNVFELRKALGEKNQLKAFQIANYFANNPKDNPMVVTTSLVFSFFSQILHYHGLKNKNPSHVASALKINPFFLKDYDVALRNYPMKKVSQIVNVLREIDVKSKGLGANALSNKDLLNEMLVKIFN